MARARARGAAARRPRRNPNGGRRKPTGTILDAITAGDRVRIRDRFGKEREGRAVMLGPYGWVLNMGGRHGTPAIATPENIVKVRSPRGNPVQHEGDERPSGPLARLWDHPDVVLGPRPRALAHLKARGVVLWMRANGSAVLFWKEGPRGKRVQHTFRKVDAANVAEVLRALNAHVSRLARPNPGAPFSGHSSVRGGELFSRRVLRLEYEHEDDPPGRARFHDFDPGVFMFAMKDGSVLLRHREHPRKRVWADLPDRGRR